MQVELKLVCFAIQKNFRGSRDDWGSGSEDAYQLCEKLVEQIPDEVIEIDSGCTIGQALPRIQAQFHTYLENNNEGVNFLIQNFNQIKLSL